MPPDRRAVLAPILLYNVVVCSLPLLEFRKQRSGTVAILFEAEIESRERSKLLVRVAEHGQKGAICRQEPEILVGQRNAQDRGLEHGPPARLARRQRCLRTAACESLGDDFSDDLESGNDVVWPRLRRADGGEADPPGNAAADRDRDSQIGAQPGTAKMLGFAGCLRRKVIGRSHRDNLARASLVDKPFEGSRQWAVRKGLHPLCGHRTEDIDPALGSELGEGATVGTEKHQEFLERALYFRVDLVAGNVGKPDRQIGKQALECQQLLKRSGGRLALGERQPPSLLARPQLRLRAFACQGLGDDFSHDLEPGNVRPTLAWSETRQRRCPDNASADRERDCELGADSGPAKVFGYAGRLRRKLIERAQGDDSSRAKLVDIPAPESRQRAGREALHPLDCHRT